MVENQDAKLASSLERTSRALEILTIVLVMLVSPFSIIISYPLNIAPPTWIALWSKYVFIFIVLGICIALVGFAAAASYRVRAQAIRQSIRKQ